MGIFDKIRQGVRRLTADLNLGRSYKDVFELDGVPPFRTFYNFCIFPAKYIYRGLYRPWHIVPAPTVENDMATRQLFRLNMAKAICAEMAGLVWNETASVNISRGNVIDENDPLERFVHDVLDENNFWTKMQEHIEQAAALGGGALKVFVDGDHAEDGQIIKGTERICIDYCMADQFIPTSWDNAEVREAVFVSREAKDGYYYTRLEWHKWDGDTYVISNDLYRADKPSDKMPDSQDILGVWYPLAAVYPNIAPVTLINGLTKSLFSYYRTPMANNVDDNSPLGVPIFANAFDTLHALDICYDSLVREFRLGKRRLVVPAKMLRTVIDPQTGKMRRFFDPNYESYEALATDTDESLMIKEIAPELRVADHVQGINANLSVLCLQTGLSAGTFTFDLSKGIKTATEVISENSKTYKTISNFQTQIIAAIKRLVENIITLGALYDIQYDGQSIRALAAGDYDVTVSMDDAVLEDAQTRMQRGIDMMANGVLSKHTFLTDPKYGIGLTDEKAEAELQQIADEGKITTRALDIFGAQTIE